MSDPDASAAQPTRPESTVTEPTLISLTDASLTARRATVHKPTSPRPLCANRFITVHTASSVRGFELTAARAGDVGLWT